jgi:hypothetical protein
MATQWFHWRHHHVGCHLSDDELAELNRVRALLPLRVREILMLGVRRAYHRWQLEQRRQQWRNETGKDAC